MNPKSVRYAKRIAGQKRNLQNRFWKITVQGFSQEMKRRHYWLLALGIRELINRRVDERLSDTGLRE